MSLLRLIGEARSAMRSAPMPYPPGVATLYLSVRAELELLPRSAGWAHEVLTRARSLWEVLEERDRDDGEEPIHSHADEEAAARRLDRLLGFADAPRR